MNILDYINEDEIIMFLKPIELLPEIDTVWIMDRTVDYLICAISFKNKLPVLLKFTKYNIVAWPEDNWQVTSILTQLQDYWSAFLYWLFKENYRKIILDKIKKINGYGYEQDFLNQNILRDLELKYHNIAMLQWPYLQGKKLERRK